MSPQTLSDDIKWLGFSHNWRVLVVPKDKLDALQLRYITEKDREHANKAIRRLYSVR
jgi:hypothetical protein